MNQPLGRAVGHSVEVLECVKLLRGEIEEGARPVLDLSIELAARMVLLAKLDDDIDAARARVKDVHQSGAALETFRRNVEAQSGDPRVCDDPQNVLPLTDKAFPVESPRSGFVSQVDTAEVGYAIAEAGGGRVRIEDKIDPRVGFISDVKIGEEVRGGDCIGVVFCDDASRGQAAVTRIQASYEIGDEAPQRPDLIKEVIDK
jgi:thymidine phosphorylase